MGFLMHSQLLQLIEKILEVQAPVPHFVGSLTPAHVILHSTVAHPAKTSPHKPTLA